MYTNILIAVALSYILSLNKVCAQYDALNTKYFVGSTLFLLGNLDSKNSPDFFQLNIGHRINSTNTISLELKTWKYAWSLGIPYGKSFEANEEKFPGYIREYGFAIAYQRFIWKRFYGGVHVMNAWQNFHTESHEKIDNGFQIFNTYRLGYHFTFFKKRFFIEPSIAVTHRAYHTPMPTSFKVLDDKWSKFFFGEPGMHVGYNF